MTLRLAIAQVNPTVGDISGNVERVLDFWRRAAQAGADLVVFPELVICGYPPEDLLLKATFVAANQEAIERLAREGPEGTVAVVGFVSHEEQAQDAQEWEAVSARQDLHNSAAVIADGRVAGIYHKGRLPTYGVFDEARWFTPGYEPLICNVAGVPVGVNICEDMWTTGGPVAASARNGARVVVVPNASPFDETKSEQREHWVRHHAENDGVWMVYVNLVGGQDGLVFAGDSVVFGPEGPIARAAQFEEDLRIVDLEIEAEPLADAIDLAGFTASRDPLTESEDVARLDEVGEVWHALVLGIRDYLGKNSFERAALGLSGGIDSSLTACLAVDAIGAENVLGMIMPSPYSSEASRRDATELAENLGIELVTIEIDRLMKAYDEALADLFAGHEPDITEENLQARIRGMLLMAASNKFGHIVLAPGNKSELAAGYATLYGDMVGGFAPLMDVPKMLVYELSRWRNKRGEVIPDNVLTKKPTAELRPDQTDEDSLPPYEVFDPIMRAYVEEYRGVDDIVERGYDRDTVEQVVALVDRSEYKRRQAAPGVKITRQAFNKDRHIPITNGWRG